MPKVLFSAALVLDSIHHDARGARTMTDRKAAVVTGGARRIGRAISLALHQAGYAVAIQANRSIAEAESLRDEITRAGGRAAVVRADLAEHASVAGLVTAAVESVGPLSLLVNNAAMFEPDSIGALDAERFDRQFAVNLRAPVFLSEAFAAQAQNLSEDLSASIVNILDQRVFKLTPQFVSYTLAKSALHSATRMLAQALAPNVRVNAVAPGPTMPSARQEADDFARQAAAVPLGHGPTAEEIAAAVVYLASARSVTGSTLIVDGGQHLAWQTPDAITKE
jgi:NAD(P)-dependent dehydrogenase (short-subunit alcohol dehydrogenase family)